MSQNKPVHTQWLKQSTVLNIRMCIYAVEFVNCMHITQTTIMKDYSLVEEPEMRQYNHLKWKLITFWFHLTLSLMMPIAFYCDWREKRGEDHQPHVRRLNRIRHVLFSSLVLPSVCFGDILFWRLWHTNKAMICPAAAHKYLTYTHQHRLHTCSLIVVILDLLLVRRHRPRSLKLHLGLMTSLVTVYSIMAAYERSHSSYIYPAFGQSTHEACLFGLMFYIEHYFYFLVQWKVVDCLWGKRVDKNDVNGNVVASYVDGGEKKSN